MDLSAVKPTHDKHGLIPLRDKPRVRAIPGPFVTPCWMHVNQRGLIDLRPSAYRTIALTNGAYVPAHRYMWALANGREVPAGLIIHHACERGGCINPAHLAAINQGENAALGNAARDRRLREDGSVAWFYEHDEVAA